MKRGLMVLFVIGLICTGVATAAVQQGDTELEFQGSWFNANAEGDGAEDIDVLFLSASLGYFFTDNLQISGGAMGAWAELQEEELDMYGLGVRARYHFMPTNQWVPYVGAQLFWANIESDEDPGLSADDSDEDALLWGPLVGLRYELNAYNDFFVEYQYHQWENDVADKDGLGLDDGHALFMGIIHQFK